MIKRGGKRFVFFPFLFGMSSQPDSRTPIPCFLLSPDDLLTTIFTQTRTLPTKRFGESVQHAYEKRLKTKKVSCKKHETLRIQDVVPGAGLEPASPCGRGILSPLRIPVSPPGHVSFVPAQAKDDKKKLMRRRIFPTSAPRGVPRPSPCQEKRELLS